MAGHFFLARHLGFALALASLTAGCGARGGESTPVHNATGERGGGVSESPEPNGVRLALLRPSADMNMAALEGVLIVDGPCLYVTGTGGSGGRTMPAFTITGARWDVSTQALVVAGVRITNGQRVRLTGGSPPTSGGLDWVQQPAPSCDKSDLFITGAIEPMQSKR